MSTEGDGKSMKLMDAEDPIMALGHYYEAEKAGLVKHPSTANAHKP